MAQVKLETSKGAITLELDESAAPVTVKNFTDYIEAGHFNGTIFHRVINGFMVQGGGFDGDFNQKKCNAAIKNEASNGLTNDRGTVAMARTNDPDSATAQFFINHADNAFLNFQGPANPGYAVFGKVTDGMDIVDEIAGVATGSNGMHDDVPKEAVEITSAGIL